MVTRSVLMVLALAACNPPIELNEDPTIIISSPEEGDGPFLEGEEVQVTFRAFDRDEDELEVVLSSSRDGQLGEAITPGNGDDETVSVLLSGGDHTVTATVTDGKGGSASDTVDISLSSAPTDFVVAISPAEPTATDDLEAEITTSSTDPDGGSITYTYVWKKDGSSQVFSDTTLAAEETEKGEEWTVTVTATDDDDLTAEATDTVTIGNTPPDEAPTVTVLPSQPLPINDLYCLAEGGSDPDDDDISYTYSWELGGSEMYTSDVLPASYTAQGDTWTCIATVTDGEDDGASDEASVEILDEELTVSEAGVAIDGESAGDGLGSAMASLSLDPVDGDDLAVGLPGDSTYASGGGMIAIFRGGALSDGLTPDERTATIKGATGTAVGSNLRTIHDVDGDGVRDLLVGAEGDGSTVLPKVFIISGDSIENALPVFASDLALATVQPLNAGVRWGNAIDGADIDGDGFADVGASYGDSTSTGKVYLFAGSDLDSTLDANDADASLSGTTANDGFGETLSMQGDVDGDGNMDVLVGAPDSGSGTNAFMFLGGSLSGSVTSSNADWTQRTTSDEGGGAHVALIPDLDGDGYDELATSLVDYSVTGKDVGAVAIFRGEASITGNVTPSSADVLLRGADDGDRFGEAFAPIDDLGSDGLAEVAVAAPAAASTRGAVYVFAGSDLAVDGTYDADTDAALVLEGESTAAALTLRGPGGDLDDDGFDDLLLTSPSLNAGAGRIYVFLTGE